jgi:hypothetical protein
MTPRARLAALLEGLPGDALLPVSWILEQLVGEQPERAATGPGDTLAHDLTVKQFGACLGRSASTARLWCERGQVPGAWKLNGRVWRIPTGSLELFRTAQGAAPTEAKQPTLGNISDWRNRKG